jgi:bifunctional enzyme CysN/CysC
MAEVAHLMVDAGLVVLVSAISPYRSERRWARELFDEREFVEVFVDTTLAECERRDVKGLYRKARAGEIRNFTGIDSPYEVPEAADIHLQTGNRRAEELAAQVADALLPTLALVGDDKAP